MNETPFPSRARIGNAVLAIAIVFTIFAAFWFAFTAHHRGVQLVEVQARLDQTADLLRVTTAEYQDTEAKLSDAQAKIAQLEPIADRVLKMPVITRLVRAGIGPGYELRIQNHSPEILELGITITPSTGANRSLRRVLDPRRLAIVNKLGPGDRVEIDSQGFNPVTLTVPAAQ